MSNSDIHEHGWTAVSRSLEKLLAGRTHPQPANALQVEDMRVLETPLAKAISAYARAELPEPTFNHSMRVFYYGQAIALQHFPSWRCSTETYLLAALLHDIGTTEANQASTRLSFEFRGGMIAHELLLRHGASPSQAEAVAETVIRHQDVGEEGNISTLTAIIHFATLLDNVGANPELVHEDTIRSVVAAWPRLKWTGCFADVVRKEVRLKPWSHTTKIEGFAEKVEANELMRPYD